MKKMTKVMVLVLMVCLMVPSLCFATTYVNACNVIKTGQFGANAMIMLTDTATPAGFPANTWFYLDVSNANSKQMLAAALTALSLGKTVFIGYAAGTPYRNISAIYVNG